MQMHICPQASPLQGSPASRAASRAVPGATSICNSWQTSLPLFHIQSSMPWIWHFISLLSLMRSMVFCLFNLKQLIFYQARNAWTLPRHNYTSLLHRSLLAAQCISLLFTHMAFWSYTDKWKSPKCCGFCLFVRFVLIHCISWEPENQYNSK